ncbi:putative surface antigen [Acinetobacter baumannii]|nr:putative surface antigen [Acinetobacter baumannii]
MVNTKQSNSVGNHTTQKEPSSNGNGLCCTNLAYKVYSVL